MTPLLQAACSPEILASAFRTSLASPGLWGVGTPMEWVRRRPERYLLCLARDLADGSYQPEPARRIEGFTADGRARAFTVYGVRDRVAQRALLRAVQPLAEAIFADTSYGYRPGLSVQMAVSRVREWLRQGPRWLLRADIHRCFASLPRDHALSLMKALTGDTAVTELVGAWLRAAPAPQTGLPLGMGLSPLMCNLSLHGLDLCMKRHALPTVRWADDLVVAAPDEPTARRAKQVMQDHLAKLGLILNANKTVIAPSAQGLHFLGQRLHHQAARLAA